MDHSRLRQLNSIRAFDGAVAYSAVRDSGVPVSVISGAEDVLFPQTHFINIQTLLPAAEPIILEKTGHMLHLENLAGLSDALVKGLQSHF